MVSQWSYALLYIATSIFESQGTLQGRPGDSGRDRHALLRAGQAASVMRFFLKEKQQPFQVQLMPHKFQAAFPKIC